MIINYGNNRTRYRNNAISDINITPFVDVLLVLLIIFMVTAPIVTGGLNVDLPEGVAKDSDDNKDNSITISIRSGGELYIGEERIKKGSLIYSLQQKTSKNYKAKIYIKADKKNGYGNVMQIIKDVNLAGFNQIVLVTEIK